ncbi:MAG: murein biosynthesis integral membrane protein MurJ [Acidobacteria bacterium]|nr:murein biosynthesis integral membrane protein MurJ [Acidobacteriota bacterium]
MDKNSGKENEAPGGAEHSALSSRTQHSALSSSSSHTHPSRVARSAGIVSLAVMGSRILGLARELVFAAYFGAGFATDAFIIAFRVPNLLRDLFAEGALSAAFVTTFSKTLATKGEAAAWRLASLVNNGLIVVLLPVVVAGVVFAPQVVQLLIDPARAAIDPARAAETFDLAVRMTRIMFPFLLMVSLAAVAMGILNTKDRFGVPASASTMFNVGSIFGGLALAWWYAPDYIGAITSELLQGRTPAPDADGAARAIFGMAIGTLVGGLMQWLIQAPSLRSVGYRWQPALSFRDEGVRQVMKLMAPAIIGVAAVQINVFVNTRFASGLGEGPVSWLNYAFRLMQFPIGVFGVAISTATLPVASRAAAAENLNEFRRTISSSLRLTFLLTIPSAVGLIVLSRPIIGLIYERGRFTSADTEQAAAALEYYALGLTAYSAIRVLAPAFYALNETRIPMAASLLSIVTNYIVASLAINSFGMGHRGLAMSVSAVALVNFALLLFFMRRKLAGVDGRALAAAFGKVTGAAILMGAVCAIIYRQVAVFIEGGGLLHKIFGIGATIGAGVVVFYFAARLLRVRELDQITAILKRRLNRNRK